MYRICYDTIHQVKPYRFFGGVMNAVIELRPGRVGVSFERVAAIAEQIIAEGGRPTLRGIRERLGSGSLGTIQAHLKDWNEGKAPVIPASTTLATDVQQAVMEEIARQVRSSRTDLETQIAQVKSERDELADENNRLSLEIEEQKAAIEALKEALAVSVGKAEAMTAQIEQQKTERQILRDQIEALKIEAATATGKAKGLAAQINEMWTRIDQEREHVTQANKATEMARIAEQACQARLEAAAREIEALKKPGSNGSILKKHKQKADTQTNTGPAKTEITAEAKPTTPEATP